MYEAKAAGRATFRFFDPRMQVALDASAALEAEMRNALARHELRLHYQPVVDGDARVTGVEALLRWQHPQRGLIAPCEFIPQAEKSGLIVELGDWVLETACLQLVRWSGAADTAALTIAVNISARQFRQPAFAEQVLAVVASSGADPRLLKLELTETMLLSDMDDVIVKMTALKARGIGFALDDFGTGYCSLNYLRRLPIEQLKIDRSFVQDMLHTRRASCGPSSRWPTAWDWTWWPRALKTRNSARRWRRWAAPTSRAICSAARRHCRCCRAAWARGARRAR